MQFQSLAQEDQWREGMEPPSVFLGLIPWIGEPGVARVGHYQVTNYHTVLI